MSAPTIADSGLKGGVAVVSGGSRGIGRAIVEVLAQSGMSVFFTYLGNAAAAAEVTAGGPEAKIVAEKVDVRDAAACSAFAEKVFEQAGGIDLLVNTAGLHHEGPEIAAGSVLTFRLETPALIETQLRK